ncbi:hypothetical protein KSP40_PGU020454 [Platanthera guangdongensis]|uniref:Uncharacterized protein n=1 Tax=Platanthera guangdongensis TaxID=2320717 RepID=A0ABR2MC67_9ASPA
MQRWQSFMEELEVVVRACRAAWSGAFGKLDVAGGGCGWKMASCMEEKDARAAGMWEVLLELCMVMAEVATKLVVWRRRPAGFELLKWHWRCWLERLLHAQQGGGGHVELLEWCCN